MENTVFECMPLRRWSFFRPTLRLHAKSNAIVEVNNLLAKQDILSIGYDAIADIEAQYNVRLRSDFTPVLKNFYTRYLDHCLGANKLDKIEAQRLQHLKRLFCIPDRIIESLHYRIDSKVYPRLLANGLFSREALFLQEIENDFLPAELSEKIATELYSGLLQEKLALAAKDHTLSHEEEKELKILSDNLGLHIHVDNISRKKLQQVKLYWALENLTIPVVETDIPLKGGEVCHYKGESVQWKKKLAPKIRSGISRHILIDDEQTISAVRNGFYLEPFDKGTVYLTNNRIIFDGRKKRTSINLNRIIGVQAYSDAIEIVRKTGKNSLFFCKEPGGPCVILDKLIRVDCQRALL